MVKKAAVKLDSAEFYGTEDKVFYTIFIIKARKLWWANYFSLTGKAETIAWFFMQIHLHTSVLMVQTL